MKIAAVPFKSVEEMATSLDRLFDECRGLREAGQKEYAGGENAFGNFIRVGANLGVEPRVVLFTYLQKHLDGIASHLRGHRSQREPVRGRIKDAIVYLGLLAGMEESLDEQAAARPPTP